MSMHYYTLPSTQFSVTFTCSDCGASMAYYRIGGVRF